MENTNYIIYTDGGRSVNPGGSGGCAAIIIDTETGEIQEYSQGYLSTTNNRMEILAVILGLEQIETGSVQIYSDSQYVANTMTGMFRQKSNIDLWKRLDKACKGKDISVHWVRGHSGEFYNEKCDELCTKAMQDMENLKSDSGYFGDTRDTRQAGKGSMGVSIQVPECFAGEKIESMRVPDYVKKYQVTESCAKSILALGKNSHPKFKDYMMIKVGGYDKWSRCNVEKALVSHNNQAELFQTIKQYLTTETDRKTCIRWYLRGLPLKDSIRKVLVDAEIQRNNFYKK